MLRVVAWRADAKAGTNVLTLSAITEPISWISVKHSISGMGPPSVSPVRQYVRPSRQHWKANEDYPSLLILCWTAPSTRG